MHLIKDENGNLIQHGHEHVHEHTHEHTHADGVTHSHAHTHGAAYLAGLAVGYWKDLEDIKNNWMVDRTFVPVLEEKTRTERIQGWKKAVKYAYGWAKQTEI